MKQKKIISAVIEEEKAIKLDEYCKRNHLRKSDVIRMALERVQNEGDVAIEVLAMMQLCDSIQKIHGQIQSQDYHDITENINILLSLRS